MAGKAIIVTGVKQIDRKLKTLEARIQKKIVRQSMRQGMKLVLADAQNRVPVLTGLTKQNIKLRAMKRSRKRIGLIVQVQRGEGLIKTTAEGKTFFYPAVVEWGHGKVPPRPFMRPAYDVKGPDARDVTMKALLEGTLREVEK